jgi:hypothetical protein
MRGRYAIGFVTCVVAACGGGSDGDPVVCDGLSAAAPTPERADVIGSIVIVDGEDLVDGAEGLERVPRVMTDAAFVDRAMPGFATPFGVFVGYQSETNVLGDCRLLEFRPASCDPACTGGDVCVEPGTCAPALAPRSIGDITIDGVGEPLVLRFDEFTGYRADHQVTPGWLDECHSVTASAPGDAGDPLLIVATHVEPLDSDVVPASLTITDGEDLQLDWDPAGAHGRVRLRWLSPNRGHGSPVAAILECDVPDSRGELTVPRALIEAMPPSHDQYCAGYDCPESGLFRYHREMAPGIAPGVELIVASGLKFRVVHNPELVEE